MGVPLWTIAEATSLSLQRGPEGLDGRLKRKRRPKGRRFHLRELRSAQNIDFRIPAIPRTTSRVAVRAA